MFLGSKNYYRNWNSLFYLAKLPYRTSQPYSFAMKNMSVCPRNTNLIILYPKYFLEKMFYNLVISLIEIPLKELPLHDIIKLFISFRTFGSNLIGKTRYDNY